MMKEMKKIGFIGYGSMGKMLAEKLVECGALTPEQITVTRRDVTRLEEAKSTLPGIQTTESITELTNTCKCIFICVKPVEFKEVLEQMKPHMSHEKHIISIAGTVSIQNIESMIKCKITKMIPTLLTEVNKGITLVCHNGLVTADDAAFVEELIQKIGKIRTIPEAVFPIATELTSCAPGFFAALFQEYIEAGHRHGAGMSREDIAELTLQTLQGTLVLMSEKKMDFEQVITRVATKGGITEEGVKVIKKHLPAVFDELFDETLQKRARVAEKINTDFENISLS